MIPKIIHYCWFGNKEKNSKILHNIDTWKKFFPQFKIIEWNEKNTNLRENEYVENAYKQKKWAFVSDFVRLKVLFVYGGIYFDTDVEVVKTFPSDILNLSAFTGIESDSLLVSPGLVLASEPKNAVIEELLKTYSNSNFDKGHYTINMRVTDYLKQDGFKMVDKLQQIAGFTIFPSEVFCAYDPISRKVSVTTDTLSIHHYDASWVPWYLKLRFKLGTYKRRFNYYLSKR